MLWEIVFPLILWLTNNIVVVIIVFTYCIFAFASWYRRFNIKRLSVEEREGLKNALLKVTADKVFLDDSRKGFIKEQADTVIDLLCGLKELQNNYRCTLLGQKGVGKTALLESFKEACYELKLQNYGLHTIEMSSIILPPSLAILASLDIIDSLILSFKVCSNLLLHHPIDTIDEYLKENGLFVFGYIDEFQTVYKTNSFLNSWVINDLMIIGDSTKGRIHWILSGSSTDLRNLISAKLPIEEKCNYPGYLGLDLNDTKFLFYTIYPFLKSADFEGILKFRKIEHDNSTLLKLYLSSCGMPRLLLNTGHRKYIATLRDLDKQSNEYELLKVIAECVLQYNPVQRLVHNNDDHDSFEIACLWTTTVPQRYVEHQFGYGKRFSSLCDTLADHGFIRYDYYGLDEPALGFISPQLMQEVLFGKDQITLEDIVALRIGNKGGSKGFNVARDATLKLIASKATDEQPFGFVVHSSNEVNNFVLETLNIDSLPECIEAYEGKMFKEGEGKNGNDCYYGADGIVVVQVKTSHQLVVNRIQVIIYDGNITEEQVKDAINRFHIHKDSVNKMFKDKLPNSSVSQRFILATTANLILSGKARSTLEAASVTVWDKSFLASHVWPPVLKRLSKQFC